ncbi:MAG: DUF2341 domain-containing protein [Nitrospirae bacterium]|nr:DUF2341 domain-containing protein [Nitrospirota bacterium]
MKKIREEVKKTWSEGVMKYRHSCSLLSGNPVASYLFTLIVFVIISTLVLPYYAHAAGGDVIWQYGDTPQAGKQEAGAMIVDSAGNTIITGASNQSGNDDYYTVMIKADGTGVLWSKVYDKASGDDHATAITVDSDSNVIVTGYVWNGSNYDYHTIKYKGSDGTVLWQHTFNAAVNGNDYATSVTVDSLNNVYVGGNSQGSNGADNCMIVKYGSGGPNPDSTPIWQKSYNGAANGHDRISSIVAGTNGIAVTGTSQNSTLDFDILTVKYGFDSTLTWEKRKSVSGDDRGVSVSMDSLGNVIMTGYVYNGANKDIYTAKYNSSNGNILWETTYSGGYDEEPEDLWVDSSGNAYVAGNTFTIGGTNDIYTAGYASGDGTQLWDEIFNSDNSNSDKAVCISGDNAGSIFVTGDTYNEVSANYDYQTLKYTAGGGTLLWQKSFNGTADKSDRVAGVGLTAAGASIVGGWTDKWTSGATDYDYYAIKYAPGLINPPTEMAVTTVSNSEIALAWTDNSSNEDGFKIERKIGELGTYSQIATVGASVTTYNNTALTADTKYYYRVKAYNAANGDSQYSNEDYAVTTVYSYTYPVWSYIYNGADNGDDFINATAAGSDNHPAVTGYSYSTAGQFDYYTVKLNRQDNSLIWDVRYDSDQNDLDVAKTIAVDNNNNVIVSGYSYLYSAQSGENTNDIYTIKYPSTGSPEDWADQYNGPAGDDDRSSVVDVSTDGNNNYAVVGYGKNASSNDDIYVIKYLNNGTRAWAAAPYDGGGNDYPSAVSFDSAGNIFMTGYRFNGANYDYFAAKYNGSTGTIIWSDIYNGAGNGNDFTRSLAVDSSGNFYVTGIAVTGSGNEDFVTIKYNGATGEQMWVRTMNGPANGVDEAISVKVDPVNGQAAVAGTVLTATGNNDFHIIRYDADGNVFWERTVDRPASDDFVTAAAMDRSGNLHVTGYSNNGANTDILSVWYNTEGAFNGGTTYNGASNGNDEASSIAVNNMGEPFIGGYTTNAGGNADYIVLKVTGYQLQPPVPLNAVPSYTTVDITWTDNSLIEDGYYLERKVGGCDSENPWALIYTAAANAVSYSDTLLNTGSQYCYRVQAYRNNGESSVWTEKATTTLTPSAPGGLSATAVNSTQIDLAWTDNTNAEDGFRIERCSGAGCSNFIELTTVSANTITYQDISVCKATAYSYRVVAYKTGEWESVYSGTASATTANPSAPGSFAAMRNSEVQINLSWTDTTSDETGFKIDRCTGAGCSDFAELTSVAAGTTTYNNAGLDYGTTYTYRVRAYKTAACTWETTSGTAAATTSISAPSGLTSSSPNSTQINLNWTDNTASETGFKIERCSGAGCSDFVEITTVAADTVAYLDTTVCDSTSYSYRVRAYKTSEWDSGYSGTISRATGTPSAPGGLGTSSATEVKLTLGWTDNTSDETGFRIERCTGAGCSDFAEITSVAANTTTYNNTGLAPSTTYSYRIRAYKDATCNGGWNTAYSSTATGITTTVPPPSGLTATAANTTQVNLAWTDNTGSETGFKVEKCTGAGCSDFAELAKTAQNTAAYSDTSACSETSYRYRVRAIKELFTSPGGSCWSKRAPMTITNFQADYQIPITVTYDADMQPDFDDIRFYDATSFTELPYWIESKTDSVNATAWIKTGANNNIYMYYGNPNAASSSNGSNVFEFFDNFTGSVIDTNKWAEIDPNNSISQNNDLILNDVSDAWDKALISKQTFARAATKKIYAKLYIPVDTAGNNHFMVGWELNQTSNASYNQLVHGFYWNNYMLNTYEKGGQTGPNTQAYTASTEYEMKVELKATGAKYYIKGGAYGSWTLVKDTSAYSDATLRIAFTQYSHQANIHFITVQKYAATDPSLSFGAEEGSGCYVFDNTWETLPSNEAAVSTASVSAPVLSTTSVGDVFVNLSWTDTTTDETGFVLERCAGAGCSDFAQIAVPGADVTVYSDTGRTLGETYSYRIKAYKTATCGWDTAYSNVRTETTIVVPPSGLTATTASTTQLNLEWSDNTGSETGFKVERCSGTGCSDFAEIASVAANTVTYQDTSVCNTTSYSYRVKAYKAAAWDSGYSSTASASTSVPGAPVLSAARISETQINLSWTDNTADETGFKVEKCAGSGCTDFVEIASLAANAVTYNNTGINPATTYVYRVSAYKTAACSWSAASNTPSATTSISAPSGLTASAVNSTQANLGWTDNTASETGFKIERCSGAGCSDFTEIASVAANAVAYQDTSVCNSTNYSYRVKAYKTGLWDSSYSSSSSAATAAIAAPGSFEAVAATDTSAGLTWADNTTDETGFRIERCEGAGCGSFTEITTVTVNTTSYSDTGLTPSMNYCYRVSAYKAATCSWNTAYSSESCDLTFSAKPTSLTATALNSMKVKLDWVDNSDDEDGFEVEVKIWNGVFVNIAMLAPNVITYTDNRSIEPDKSYTFRIRAYRGEDKSSYSNEASAITPAYQQGDETCNE